MPILPNLDFEVGVCPGVSCTREAIVEHLHECDIVRPTYNFKGEKSCEKDSCYPLLDKIIAESSLDHIKMTKLVYLL